MAPDQVAPNAPRGAIQAMISAQLGSAREMRQVGGAGMGMGMQHGNPSRSFDVRLRDGQWVRLSAAGDAVTPALPNDLIARLLLTLVIVTVGVMIAVRQATRPLQQLARAADLLGRDLDAPPLAELGPTETRHAAQAFNRMQARIKRLVDERSRALAAVSHDLRTPLTRLRLRTELVEDEKLRDQMAADLETMATMLDATLDYLRGLQASEAARPIDINALLASLSGDALVTGRRISIEGTALAPYSARLSALRRALQNLIDNAIKYGSCAHLRVHDDANELRIAVEDEGPGIAPQELERVTEPYYRPDASRNSATGGLGLGLSIVKDIALLHGGDLLLANRTQGGLCATLRLPRPGLTT
jgi:signal transduction histidine kinase